MHYNKSLEDIWNLTSGFMCIDDSGTYSNDNLKRKVEELYKVLLKSNLSYQDRIIYLAKNSHETVVVMFACLKAKCILAPVSSNIPLSKLLKYIEDLQARAIILAESDFSDAIKKQLLKRTSLITYTPKYNYTLYCAIAKRGQSFIDQSIRKDIGGNDIVFVLFTSGTASESKAAIYTQEKVLNMLAIISDYMEPNGEDVFFCMKQPQHVSTWIGEILLSVYVDVILSLRKTSLLLPRLCIGNMIRDKANIIFTNPSILSSLIKVPCESELLGRIHSVYVSGAPLDESIHRKADCYFAHAKICNVYGLTEAGPRVLAQRRKEETVYGACGKPVKEVSVFIKHYNEKTKRYEEITEAGTIGEIFVESPCIIPGYWNGGYRDENSLHTNDIGYFDKQGNFFVVGRKDDIIFYHSHNVNPAIVEACINAHENINSCVVFGSNKRNGENTIVALYKTRNDCEIDERLLYHYIRSQLEPYECPAELYKVKKCFVSPYGKVNRNEARMYYENTILKL